MRTLCNIASGEIAPAGIAPVSFKPETGLPRFLSNAAPVYRRAPCIAAPAQRRARVSPRPRLAAPAYRRAPRNAAPRVSPRPRLAAPAYRRTRATPRPVRQKYIRQRRGCQPVILCRIRTDFSFFHRRQVASALTRRGASCIHRIFRAVHISSYCTDSFYPPFESSGNIIQIYPLRIKRPKVFADLSGVSLGIKREL